MWGSLHDSIEKNANRSVVQILLKQFLSIASMSFTDVKLSKDMTEKFEERVRRTNGHTKLDFSIMVLATNLWSLKPPTHEFVIPQQILPTYTGFRQYYNQAHEARQLTWLWNYSRCELRTNYLNQNYLLLVSAYQTAILLQFNDHDTLSLDELFKATSISKDYLGQVLALLVKAKILFNEETDQYDLNPSEYSSLTGCSPKLRFA